MTGRALDRVNEAVGGRARRRVILLLAAVLAVASADQATVGAIAVPLERSLGIGNTGLGLLVTVSSVVAALATLPLGVLTDRTRRTWLLSASISIWAAAMIVSAASVSFAMLLLTRVALGAAAATAGPAVASLVGDLFPAGERGRVYGFILTGELLGAGFGLVVSGEVAGLLGWRASFVALALPAAALAWAVHRLLPEPARGGEDVLVHESHPGGEPADPLRGFAAVGPGGQAPSEQAPSEQVFGGRGGRASERRLEADHVAPDAALVLHESPSGMGLWRAVRYVLRIRTNVVLIVASSLGYFFFAGLKTFAVVFVRGHFGLGQALATLLVPVIGAGAVVGVLSGGRIADWMRRRGRVDARIVVGAVAYVGAVVFFLPGLLASSLAVALPLSVLGAAGLGAANPPLDAARLDIMHSRLRGRAESVRTVLRTAFEATAPLLFGYISDVLGRGAAPHAVGRVATHAAGLSAGAIGSPRGLQLTFVVMLVPLLAGAVLLLRARRSYPVDVATALASEDATSVWAPS